ncbi:MAG: GNAT family N-acetyltransferase [Candidatus Nitrosocosmicus sp.]|jgi:glucosamine-phosphate N-acetyltransferase|uniref:GNAT family N-acetyltransferase n=1 Tax=Candidatus Nitrosocosmicus agrestis TaxID=2563600 RepID=UPI00122E534A|nr:GNAT family N-acetyltransferase [Candidatus Nitrosocosmicus sp. SS]KAA2279601.1 GNAT family N-acetyltransferase [Candidatus Nitrosocosmicus sp. SS]KAF0868246.1 GNAT family N-acetyltransferase [Candidatus Nitrosocosmicus sp. SS]MDR4489889.1 GNAT family N-acetyltransferase [Candidatus Nitrosocosmicus sp.]
MISFLVRRIKEADFENGFFETLSNLTTVGDIRFNEYRMEIINRILGDQNYIIIVAEEQENHTIIGTATLLIEQKFIHNGGRVGHIEDVATRAGFEGIGVGKKIIQKLIETSKELQCYKIILDCDDKVIGFYEKLGFKKKAVMMRLDL